MYTGPMPGAYQNSPLTNTLGTLSSLGSLFSNPNGGTSPVQGLTNWWNNLGNNANTPQQATNTYNQMMNNGGFGTGNTMGNQVSAISGTPIAPNQDLGQFF
jgi:hypothetical protein